eukprot:6487920-Amphidinium_carterae.2
MHRASTTCSNALCSISTPDEFTQVLFYAIKGFIPIIDNPKWNQSARVLECCHPVPAVDAQDIEENLAPSKRRDSFHRLMRYLSEYSYNKRISLAI